MYVINVYINRVIIAEGKYITGPIQIQKYYEVQYTLFPIFNQNNFGFYAIMKSTTFPALKKMPNDTYPLKTRLKFIPMAKQTSIWDIASMVSVPLRYALI